MSEFSSRGPVWSNGTVPEGTVVGRAAGGDVAALTPAQAGIASLWHHAASPGLYYASGNQSSAGILAEGFEVAQFWIPQRSCTIDKLAVYMTVAGSAGAVVRLGLRDWDFANDAPGSLLVDAGAADATGAAGALERTLSYDVVAGHAYALTATIQGAASTRPTLIQSSGRGTPMGMSAPGAATGGTSPYVSGTTGSLVANPTWNRTGTANGPRIWARVAT